MSLSSFITLRSIVLIVLHIVVLFVGLTFTKVPILMGLLLDGIRLQLTLRPSIINAGMTIQNLSPGMVR